MEPGKYEKALPYVNKAIARSRLLPTREGLMLGLSLKITILKHLGAQPAADITHKELIQFIAAERDSALILDQAQLVYQLRAWETAEMLLQDSINCMQKSKQASKQTLPACIYLLENVHVRLANSESALNDFDLLLSLYDKYGSLPGVPPRAVIARQRADLTARL